MSDVGDLVAGRYRLQRHVGSGAMGVVWQAVDERLGRTVAVKQLLPRPGLDAAAAEQARQRALREGRIAARLHHPHAVTVHDVTEHDGQPVIVMEYFPGRSLADVLDTNGPLTPQAAAALGGQVASALAAAHEAGIVHRDVKPANVLIGADGTAKLADFGIAHAGGDATASATGTVAGTPAYLAPEVARGQAPTPSSDVFSLGSLLFAAVEGSPPFGDEENSLAVLYRVAEGVPASSRQAGPLRPVLASILVTDPRARPAVERVRDALRAVAYGRTPQLAPAPAAEELTQPLARVPAAAPRGTRLDLRPVSTPPPPMAAPAPAPPMAPPLEPRSSRRRALAIGGGALVLVAGVVTTVLATSGGERTPLTQVPPTTTTPTTTSPAPVATDDLRTVVADFYAALPNDTTTAWALLGPVLRAQGQEEFTREWANVKKLSVISQPRPTGEDSVHIGIRLRLKDDSEVTEFHQHTVTRDDGVIVIASDLLLHSETKAPPKKDEKDKDDKKKKKEEEKEKKKKEKEEEKRKKEEEKKKKKDDEDDEDDD